MKLEAYFGHVGVENGGHHIAVCKHCLTAVFMTEEQRGSTGIDILRHLDHVVGCCGAPYYSFFRVVPFANIKQRCPTCGQEINKEDC